MEVLPMSDDQNRPASPNVVDAEFAGEHGTTASSDSVENEKEPGFHPQNAHQVAEKIDEEAAGELGVLGKAKKALEEVDRQVAGEYEKRDDRDAPAKEQAAGAPDQSERAGAARPTPDQGDSPAKQPNAETTPDPAVAGAAVEAESERFDGLINEPGNPPRQQRLDPERNDNDRA
jgi:hypothetical protein